MKLIRRFLLIIGVFLISFLLFTIYLTEKTSSFIYGSFGVNIPKGSYFIGADISHYQGNVNWDELDTMSFEGDSIRFLYHKATEGISHIDSKMKHNQIELEKRSIPYGYYHYFIPSESAIKQAHHFTSSIKEYDYQLKPVLDIEVIGELEKGDLVDSIKVFIKEVEWELKQEVIIYTYYNFYHSYLKDQLKLPNKYWMANYNADFEFGEMDNVILWQFTENANVNGILGPVDLNLAKEKNWDDLFWD